MHVCRCELLYLIKNNGLETCNSAKKKNTAKKINYRVKSGLHVKEGEKNYRGWNRQKVAATEEG